MKQCKVKWPHPFAIRPTGNFKEVRFLFPFVTKQLNFPFQLLYQLQPAFAFSATLSTAACLCLSCLCHFSYLINCSLPLPFQLPYPLQPAFAISATLSTAACLCHFSYLIHCSLPLPFQLPHPL